MLAREETDAVVAWLGSAGLGGGPWTFEPLAGGTQNLMLRAVGPDRRVVVRSGPRHLRAGSNAAIEREIRVLGALASTDVPHPRLLATAPADGVLPGRVVYAMAEVPGVNVATGPSPAQAADPALRHAVGPAMVDALAALHAVDVEAVGLGDVGRPQGFLARQVPRWRDELARHREVDGYPGFGDDAGDVADWLERHLPVSGPPALAHGDYHLANVLVDPDGAAVTAIVDWEMATVADPLLDLGWLLATWPVSGTDLGWARVEGLAGEDELVARYAELTGTDPAVVPWYAVMACFKLGVLLEGTHARACAGKAPADVGARMHAAARSLIDQARRRIRQSQSR
ncbi:phosphotransferase family protein [Actinomycetospora rhizophila]|uniref:Phosphotransferase family protein n=1 Tax=Actinomycetospora rhizophila TaxID=1416876 RepID=A0ABV9ZRE5_9PSEU